MTEQRNTPRSRREFFADCMRVAAAAALAAAGRALTAGRGREADPRTDCTPGDDCRACPLLDTCRRRNG